MSDRCEYPRCKAEATTTYQDKARQIWKLCEEHRAQAKRRKV